MVDNRIRKVVVAGSGARLSLAGAVLANSLKEHGVAIECLEFPQPRDELLADSLGPEVVAFHRMIRLPDSAIASLADAGYHLGYRCQREESHWFIPYGPLGLKEESIGLEAAVLKYVREHSSASLLDFSLAAQAALRGRFGIPGKGGEGIAAALTAGFNVSREKYSALLRRYAKHAGVIFNSSSSIKGIERDDSGFLRSLKVDSGRQITADLWISIDRHGPVTALCDGHRPADRTGDSYTVSEWVGRKEDALRPSSGLVWTGYGWLKSVPLQSEVVWQFYHQSDVNHHVRDWLTREFSPPGRVYERTLQREAPHYRPWQGNLLSLLPSSKGMVCSDLTALLMQLSQFLDVYPDKNCSSSVVSAYNAAWERYAQEALEFEESFDERLQSERLKPRHNPLQQRLELFQATGQLPPSDSDAVRDVQWQAQLLGLGVIPQRDSVFLNTMDQGQIENTLVELARTISNIAAAMPSHDELLQKLRAAQSV